MAQQTQINVDSVLDKLATRVATLEKDKAILLAQFEALQEENARLREATEDTEK